MTVQSIFNHIHDWALLYLVILLLLIEPLKWVCQALYDYCYVRLYGPCTVEGKYGRKSHCLVDRIKYFYSKLRKKNQWQFHLFHSGDFVVWKDMNTPALLTGNQFRSLMTSSIWRRTYGISSSDPPTRQRLSDRERLEDELSTNLGQERDSDPVAFHQKYCNIDLVARGFVVGDRRSRLDARRRARTASIPEDDKIMIDLENYVCILIEAYFLICKPQVAWSITTTLGRKNIVVFSPIIKQWSWFGIRKKRRMFGEPWFALDLEKISKPYGELDQLIIPHRLENRSPRGLLFLDWDGVDYAIPDYDEVEDG